MDLSLSQKYPGEFRRGDKYRYFLPADLFMSRELEFGLSFQSELEKTVLKLGQFSAKIKNIPNVEMFIRSFYSIESVQSTRIEGTQSTIEAYFREREESARQRDDWLELHQYTMGLQHAVTRLETARIGIPFIKDIHKILLSHARGRAKQPGEFRQTQNWIGGGELDQARFVPPLDGYVEPAMTNLEKFIQSSDFPMPNLVKAALIHFQFETIHPFSDGNGRMGRILIPLYLMESGVLDRPILYISDFFANNRRRYFKALNVARISSRGVVDWILFFFEGVRVTAENGIAVADRLQTVRDEVNVQFMRLGRRAKTAQRLGDLLFNNPILNSVKVGAELRLKPPVVQALLAEFVRLGILIEITGQKRNRIFAFEKYLNILRRSTLR